MSDIFKRLMFYKRAVQFFLALNVVTVTSGVFACLSYYGSNKALATLASQNITTLDRVNAIEENMVTLLSDDGRDPYESRHHLDTLIAKLEAWPGGTLADIVIHPSSKRSTKLPAETIETLFKRTRKERNRLQSELHAALNQIANITRQLMIVAVMTIIFGIILPAIVFWKLSSTWYEARVAFEERFSKWLAEWHTTWRRHGDKPWKDSSFWLNVVLLTVESFAPKLQHPVAHFFGEFAPILRREIAKFDDETHSGPSGPPEKKDAA